jgi:CheY-like chemotaxis protein
VKVSQASDGILNDVHVTPDLRKEWASHWPFTKPNLHTSFQPDRVAIETNDGEIVEERFNLAKTQNFDLYLVDNWMPALSGQDLTKKLREFDVKTPILFYSGAAYERYKEAAGSSGAQG